MGTGVASEAQQNQVRVLCPERAGRPAAVKRPRGGQAAASGDAALFHDPYRAWLRVRLARAVIQCAVHRGRAGKRQDHNEGPGAVDRWLSDRAGPSVPMAARLWRMASAIWK